MLQQPIPHRLTRNSLLCQITKTLSSRRVSTSSPLFRHPRGIQPRYIKMSWMDSWSRPSKSQATPAPFYLLPGGESTPYCHSCGRVIGSRKTTASSSEPPKYCSSRCRSHKPGNLDRKIERAFVQFLTGQQGADLKAGSMGGGAGVSKGGSHKSPKALKKQQKGDPRILVPCDMIENFMFGDQDENTSEGTSGSEENGRTDTVTETEPRTSESDVQDDLDIAAAVEKPYIDGDVLARMSVRSGTRIRPPQSISEVNGSVGGEKGRAERIEESEEMLEKRIKGQKRAKEREMVRCAARRGVVFGFPMDSEDTNVQGQKKQGAKGDGNLVERRKCEAVMLGKVVEPSFAKGDWCIRWRE